MLMFPGRSLSIEAVHVVPAWYRLALQPSMLIIRGVVGSGKTTFRHWLEASEGGLSVSLPRVLRGGPRMGILTSLLQQIATVLPEYEPLPWLAQGPPPVDALAQAARYLCDVKRSLLIVCDEPPFLRELLEIWLAIAPMGLHIQLRVLIRPDQYTGLSAGMQAQLSDRTLDIQWDKETLCAILQPHLPLTEALLERLRGPRGQLTPQCWVWFWGRVGQDTGTQLWSRLGETFSELQTLRLEGYRFPLAQETLRLLLPESLCEFLVQEGILIVLEGGYDVREIFRLPLKTLRREGMPMPLASSYTLLLLSCNPPDHPLNTEHIVARIQAVLKDSPIRVVFRGDLHFHDLDGLLREHRPALVQFIGHGLPGGRLQLKNQEGRVSDFAPEAVAQVIAAHSPRMVLLSACYSLTLAEHLRARGIPAAIGTSQEIPDQSIEAFSHALYGSLAGGELLSQAFSAAQAVVCGETPGKEGIFQLCQGQDVHFGVGGGPILAPDPSPVADRATRQVLIWADLDSDQPSQAEVEGWLPDARSSRVFLRLSELGAPRINRHERESDIPWQAIQAALCTLHARLGQLRQESCSTRYFVVGGAPLPVFVAIGSMLGRWISCVTLLNRKSSDVIAIDGPQNNQLFFDRVVGLGQPSQAEGRLDLYVSCHGDGFSEYMRALKSDIPRAGEVTLSTQNMMYLNGDNGPRAAAEVKEAFSALRTSWPAHTALRIAVRGPIQLAVMVGRAINPHMEGDVILLHHSPRGYEAVLGLPLSAVRPA